MEAPFLPYCAPLIGQEEIDEVIDSLRNNWLTTGPKVKIFEENFAHYVGAKHAVAVNSCTAALTLALAALNIGPGDEVIVPTLTFCATANVIEHRGATPILVDVTDDCQIDPEAVRRVISPRTRAIMPVHYGGQACDLQAILDIARDADIPVIQDAAHAVGAQYRDRKIGADGLVSAFSFYPSKNMTTGEGGMLTTNDDAFDARLRRLSQFGIHRPESYSWYYEVQEPGYKSNMMDLQAAIGIHQLRKLDGFISRRREIATRYSQSFADLDELILPADLPGRPHAHHLYTLRIAAGDSRLDRNSFIRSFTTAGVGTSVHFIPLHKHPFYRSKYSYSPASFPVAEMLYRQIVSLPLYPAMDDADVARVIATVRGAARSYRNLPLVNTRL
jgi:dTDP-4-amino-4,6-dideoxygalactose transaminase